MANSRSSTVVEEVAALVIDNGYVSPGRLNTQRYSSSLQNRFRGHPSSRPR